jgi:hypothetical protein
MLLVIAFLFVAKMRDCNADFDLSFASPRRAQIAQRLVRTKIESQEQAVAEFVTSDDPWLKSCGAYAIGALGLKSLEDRLDQCMNEQDPLLRETARAAKLRLETPAAKP